MSKILSFCRTRLLISYILIDLLILVETQILVIKHFLIENRLIIKKFRDNFGEKELKRVNPALIYFEVKF
jgi:hypothetical protein